MDDAVILGQLAIPAIRAAADIAVAARLDATRPATAGDRDSTAHATSSSVIGPRPAMTAPSNTRTISRLQSKKKKSIFFFF